MNMQNYPQNFQDRINMSDDLINAIRLLSENQLNMINEKLDDDVLIQKILAKAYYLTISQM
jgi:hypothetical protein